MNAEESTVDQFTGATIFPSSGVYFCFVDDTKLLSAYILIRNKH